MRIKNDFGFTLVETIIYTAILGIVLVAFVSFSISVMNLRNKSYAEQEVQSSARLALNVISQKIRAATAAVVNDSQTLTLTMDADSGKNPTIIRLNSSVLQIQEGAGAYIDLVGDRVRVTSLTFTDLAPSGERTNIGIAITVAYYNPGGDITYNFSQSLETSVSTRR